MQCIHSSNVPEVKWSGANAHTEIVPESRKFSITEQETLENGTFLKILKKNLFLEIFDPERKYRIPENPIPGLFRNTKFRKMFYSRTSGFPKQKKWEWFHPSAKPCYLSNRASGIPRLSFGIWLLTSVIFNIYNSSLETPQSCS